MAIGLARLAEFLSESSAARVAATARRVATIRLGTHEHLCATLWSSDIAVTCSQALPEQDSYLLLLEQGHAIAHLAWRDDATGLAGLRLSAPNPLQAGPSPDPIEAGTWLIAIGIDETGRPVASLVVAQSDPASPPEASFGIDRAAGPGDRGGPLIAASGAVVGIVTGGAANGTFMARAVASPEITRLVGETHAPAMDAAPIRAEPARPRGWLGAGLQPSTLPREFSALAGQGSGRKVVDIVPGGPADCAGMVAGDIVLTIAEQTMVGDGAVREFLSHARIGETAQIVLLRSGRLVRLNITVSENPAG